MIIYTDGGSRGNPGKSACAFVIVDKEKIIHEESKYLGIKTNNEAEYNAIILALKYLQKVTINTAEIVSDSQLVIRQINKEYKITKKHLRILNEEVSRLCENKKITFSNVKRENKFVARADFLVNKKLDEN